MATPCTYKYFMWEFIILVEVPTIHANPLTLPHLLPEGINQLTRKLFLHC
jgi:hypothetical protein